MTYVVRVPFEVSTPLSLSDPDVRSISRLPGFVQLELIDRDNSRYELTFEVEAGSVRDAGDASEELLVDYQDTLAAYRPRLLTGIAPEVR